MPRNPRGLNFTSKPDMDDDKMKEQISSFVSSKTSKTWDFPDIETSSNSNSKNNSPKK